MDIVEKLDLKANLIMGKDIGFGSEVSLMFEASEEIQTLRAKVEVLVEALRGAEAIVKSAILLEVEVEPYISESTYELNGCLGENAANISVRGRGVLNKITEALATYTNLVRLNMTQNNEREAFYEFEDLLEQLYWEFDAERAKKSRGERDIFKGKLRFIAKKYKAPISQNEQQDVVAWVVKIPESRRGCSNDIVFYYKMSEMLKEHILAGDDVTPLYASPPKQIPDGWKLIGKVSEMGVIWHKQNPHAHPVGTEFYAVLPTTSLTSETNTGVGE